jgi:hypothetical protein
MAHSPEGRAPPVRVRDGENVREKASIQPAALPQNPLFQTRCHPNSLNYLVRGAWQIAREGGYPSTPTLNMLPTTHSAPSPFAGPHAALLPPNALVRPLTHDAVPLSVDPRPSQIRSQLTAVPSSAWNLWDLVTRCWLDAGRLSGNPHCLYVASPHSSPIQGRTPALASPAFALTRAGWARRWTERAYRVHPFPESRRAYGTLGCTLPYIAHTAALTRHALSWSAAGSFQWDQVWDRHPGLLRSGP